MLEYSLPRAIVTNYHKLGSLKQDNFILLLFQIPDIQNQDISSTKLHMMTLENNLFFSLPLSAGLRHSLNMSLYLTYNGSQLYLMEVKQCSITHVLSESRT